VQPRGGLAAESSCSAPAENMTGGHDGELFHPHMFIKFFDDAHH
jgi:hypothetical protein